MDLDKNNYYRCQLCDGKTKDEGIYIKHLTNDHKIKIIFPNIVIPNSLIGNKYKFACHKYDKIHNLEDLWSHGMACDLDDKKVRSRYNDEKDRICKICNGSYGGDAYIEHFYKHGITLKTQLMRKDSTFNGDGFNYMCNNCGNSYCNINYIISHKYKCRGKVNIQNMFKCEHCGNKYATPGEMSDHYGQCYKKPQGLHRIVM